MLGNFIDCLPIILQSEGGFVDDPQDPGGATSLGITLETLSGWMGRPATIQDVRNLTVPGVSPIYKLRFWDASGCDQLPIGVDLMVFDCAVNSGPRRAAHTLQEALGVASDGVIGPVTISQVLSASPFEIIDLFAGKREAFYRHLPTFGRFGNGWLSRLSTTQGVARAMAGK